MEKLPEIQGKTRYAGFTKRLKAFACDYLIILSYIVLLAGATLAMVKIAGVLGLSLRWSENPFLAAVMAFITLIANRDKFTAEAEQAEPDYRQARENTEGGRLE